jgi:hypothetical protein
MLSGLACICCCIKAKNWSRISCFFDIDSSLRSLRRMSRLRAEVIGLSLICVESAALRPRPSRASPPLERNVAPWM